MIFIHTLKRISTRTVLVTLAGLPVGCWVPLALGNDFESLEQQIQNQQSLVTTLESHQDYANHKLLEPLLELARTQVLANRFDDARESLSHAAQVVRIRDGLFAASQYSIIEQTIENDIRRGAWQAATEQLEHLQWLYAERFQGSVEEQVDHLMWASDTHLRGVFDDQEVRVVQHLKDATRLNTLAFQLASRQDSLEVRARVAYSLAQKHHLEAQGIRLGDQVGFKIRSHMPESGRVDGRKKALLQRYNAGLGALWDVRDQVQQLQPDNAEALAMIDISIADWQLLFNKREALQEYPRLYKRLQAAGIDRQKLDALFAQPVTLPRPALYLDLESALAAADMARTGPVTLIERSAYFPGIFAATLPDSPGRMGRRDTYLSAEAELLLDPFKSTKAWLGGTLRTNWGTASEIRFGENSDSREADLSQRLIAPIQELHLRPAVVDGELRASRVAVRYLVRHSNPARAISVWDALQVSQL
jgi:hypothetical protein